MKRTSKHTFVILAYKEPKYIGECIKSLKKQTLKSEIVITTSTATDYIRNIAKKHEVELVEHSKGGSIAKDWDFAYEYAKSQFVTLAHEDDIYLPEFTETTLEFMKKFDPIFVSTKYSDLLEGNLRVSYVHRVKNLMNWVFYIRSRICNKFWKDFSLKFGNSISCPSVTYNKEKIGNFKFSNEYKVNLDWDAWLRLSRMAGCIAYINKTLMHHRLHREAQTSINIVNGSVRSREDFEIFRRLWPRPIARFLAKMYSLSYPSSVVK